MRPPLEISRSTKFVALHFCPHGAAARKALRRRPWLFRQGINSHPLSRSDADVGLFGAPAGHAFSSCKRHLATVGELHVAADKWSASFQNVHGTDWNATKMSAMVAHGIALFCVPVVRHMPQLFELNHAKWGYARNPQGIDNHNA